MQSIAQVGSPILDEELIVAVLCPQTSALGSWQRYRQAIDTEGANGFLCPLPICAALAVLRQLPPMDLLSSCAEALRGPWRPLGLFFYQGMAFVRLADEGRWERARGLLAEYAVAQGAPGSDLAHDMSLLGQASLFICRLNQGSTMPTPQIPPPTSLGRADFSLFRVRYNGEFSHPDWLFWELLWTKPVRKRPV